MKKIIFGLLMIFAVVMLMAGCQSKVQIQAPAQNAAEDTAIVDDSKTTETAGETKQVAVKDFKYNPLVVVVNVGDTIEWVNNEQSVPHTVTFDDNSYDEKLPVGATATRVFNEKGTFAYYCALHPSMQAQVIVN
ncbi:cupredoxin domain-containing protein [Candidatus Woesearchaeota archaeon]|nr:cupredoxin domain-containing protein [Candidatus Woesearchaeota archaeon]